jgi:hypothetical protein
MDKPTRKQIREGLQQIPMEHVLGVSKRLTHKQKQFAKGLAMGKTASGAYREAYDSKGKPSTVGEEARRLKTNPLIAREVEAIQAAITAAEYRTPAHLRELVVHSLVKVLVDPDAKDAIKVQAARVLGTVSEVSAFTARTEVTHVTSSKDARDTIMLELKRIMKNDSTDIEYSEADSLLQELAGDSATPTPTNGRQESQVVLHTIPDIGLATPDIGSPAESTPLVSEITDPPTPQKNLDEQSK